MGEALRKLFNLYPGEERKAGLFVLLAFLWSLGGYGSFTLSEGMFLEHVGAHGLPSAYLGIAVGMCILSSFLLFALHRLSLHYLLISVLLGAIACHTITYFCLTTTSLPHFSTFWFLFKITGWIVPVSTYICFWAFVDQFYDLQDAKRFFCLFNSITFFGDACAGGIISWLLEPLGLSKLLGFFILVMIASIPVIFLIRRKIVEVPEDSSSSSTGSRILEMTPKTLLKTILQSRFTMILMGFYFLMQILSVTTEYSYMASFERIFKTALYENALTEFLGTCGMWVSLGNMIFCLFFYSRLVKKIGVSNIVLVAPTFFLGIFFAWVWKDALPIAIFGFIAREGMAYSFDDNNLNLLVSGVPTKVKNQVRIAIESFFEPIGMIVSALLLLVLQEESCQLGLVLAFCALGLVFLLRNHYHRAIFFNLVAHSIRFEKKASEWLASFSKREKKEIEFHLLTKLRKAEESTQLLAYEYLLKIHNPRLLPRLLTQFGRLSIPGKLKAIELLSESQWAKENIVKEHLERWRRLLPHPSIKSSIHFYFARHSLVRPERIMHDLNNEHLGLRGAAILSLKTSMRAPSPYLSLATEKLKLMLDSSDEKEICMGIKILNFEYQPDNIDSLFPFLKHPSHFVNRSAARAIASLAHPQFHTHAALLVRKLPLTLDSEIRLSYLMALEKFQDHLSVKSLILSSTHFRPRERKLVENIVLQIGSVTVPDLLELLQNAQVHVKSRLLAGKILGKLSLKDLKSHIYPLIQQEIHRAYFYYFHGQTIQKQLPAQDLSILENALITGYEGIIDFIIQLLGISGSIEESEVLSLTLRSKNRKIRAQAFETLEKTCEPRMYALLEPLIDERRPELRLRDYLKQGGLPLNLDQLLDVLAKSGSIADQIVSLSFKARLNIPGWKKSVREKLESNEEIFHHFALELLNETQHEIAQPH